ncbi:chromate transporter [Agathobaculum sp. TL06]
MILWQLFFEFFKIGLFAIGGGMATLPFLQRLSEQKGWFPIDLITDMVAISESTPGPLGINMATYVGFQVSGVIGGIVATLGTILPAIVIVSIVSAYLDKFRHSPIADHIFYGLRPAVTGLIIAAGYDVMKVSFINVSQFVETWSFSTLVEPVSLLIFAIMFVAIRRLNRHPVTYIGCAAVIGLLFKL